MPKIFDVITFDCYGTLIDWETGIRAAFEAEARRDGRTLDLDRVIATYHDLEPQAQAKPFRTYREVLVEVALGIAERLDWPIDADRARFLPEGLPDWPAFPDTEDGLNRLAASGHRLGILSNVDDDLLEGTRRLLPAVFDPELVVTAQQVRSYKPALGHFEEARRRIGDSQWAHAAQSLFHDIRPADQAGLPTAWVNRKNEPKPDWLPESTIVVGSLAELADFWS